MKLLLTEYEFKCSCTPSAAVKRIESLLAAEGVRFNTNDVQIVSTHTPLAVLGIQPTLYSHKNWIGLNPFTFISGVSARCEPANNGETEVLVSINRRRSYLFVLFWALCASLAARQMPEPIGWISVLAVTSVAWIGIVNFLSGYVVTKEIREALES